MVKNRKKLKQKRVFCENRTQRKWQKMTVEKILKYIAKAGKDKQARTSRQKDVLKEIEKSKLMNHLFERERERVLCIDVNDG